MKKMPILKSLCLLTAVIMLIPFTTGCLSLLPFSCLPFQSCTVTVPLTTEAPQTTEPAPTPAPSPTPDATEAPAPTETSGVPDATETPSPTKEAAVPSETPPVDEAVRHKAVTLAAEHGISEERLFGQYELFLRYADTVERNPSLGKYREFVIRAFPALADNALYLDEDYFFPRLESLSITDVDPTDDYIGVYYYERNEILMAEEYSEYVYFTIYHELLHFIDHSISKETGGCYVLMGRILTDEDYEALSPSDRLKTRMISMSDFYSEVLVEAGAELFTAKYFTGAPTGYTEIVSFLTGIEYVYGSETVKRIFFSPDSSIFMAKLIQDLGYNYSEMLNLNQYLAWLTDPDYYYEPAVHYPVEDLLIKMYEQNMEGDWRDDKRFRYILACVNGVGGETYLESEHAEELAQSNFLSYLSYISFESKLLKAVDPSADIYVIPPSPMVEEDRLMLCAPGIWRDPDTKELKYGALRFDYDFENKAVVSYEAIEGETMPE